MKVHLAVGPDTQIEIKKDQDGRVTEVVLQPSFVTPKAVSVLARCVSAKNSGTPIETFSLLVSGKTGKVTKAASIGSSVAAVDDPGLVTDAAKEPTSTKPATVSSKVGKSS